MKIDDKNKKHLIALSLIALALLTQNGQPAHATSNGCALSKEGATLIQSFESLRLTRYRDAGGFWTIGYGHLIRTDEPDIRTISRFEAQELFYKDVRKAEIVVNHNVRVRLSQEEFDSLVALEFNIGQKAFISSTLLRKLNSGDIQAAAHEFPRWSKVNGKDCPGLVRRRLLEERLFLLGQHT